MRRYILSLILLPVLTALAQSGEIDILDIIAAQPSGQVQAASQNSGRVASALDHVVDFHSSPLDYVSAGSSALDYVTDSSSALDYVAEGSSALDFITGSGRAMADAGIGVLDAITGAYAINSFYTAGAWSNLRSSSVAARYGTSNISAAGAYGSITSASAASLYASPEWGRITSGFGYRSSFKRMHKGIDIAMAVGDTVRAVMPGVVDRTGYEARGYGHYIIVKHDDGMETRYAHLSMPLVAGGQRVAAHEAIALSGNTGNSTGPHLHFETRFNGTAIDPATIFDFTGSGRNLYNASYADAYGNYAPASESNRIATGLNATKTALTTKRTYIVREGDTLQRIADRAGISVMRLCQLNGILDNELPMVGTMLRLR